MDQQDLQQIKQVIKEELRDVKEGVKDVLALDKFIKQKLAKRYDI